MKHNCLTLLILVLLTTLLGCAQKRIDWRSHIDDQVILDQINSKPLTKQEAEAYAFKAMDRGRCVMALKLVKDNRLDPNIPHEYKKLFQCLVQSKNFDEALEAFKLGADPNFIKEPRYPHRWTAIEELTAYGQFDIVRELLKKGVKPTGKALYLGVTAEYCCTHGLIKYEYAEKTLELFTPFANQMDVNYKYSSGETVLYKVLSVNYFSEDEKFEITRRLLRLGADPNVKIRKTVKYGVVREVDYYSTPLVLATGQGKLSALLLSAGAQGGYVDAYQQALFVSKLKPGDNTKQGFIVEIKNNLALIQGKNSQRWFKLLDLHPVK